MKRASAIAQPNIALIKYWGKRDVRRNLPAVGSISITLGKLHTSMALDPALDQSTDSLRVNGTQDLSMVSRVSRCLDSVIGHDRPRVAVTSESNFPIAAGLASSASSFAALTVAAAAADGQELSTRELASCAGHASGSAARSLYGGFAELSNDGDEICVQQIRDSASWPLVVVLAITTTGPKATGSTQAMEISRQTSPFYDKWIAGQADDLAVARQAIANKDFRQLAAVAEHNCLKMHSVMWASRPPTVFWNAATLRCLETIRDLQNQGLAVFFTIDAGPQVKAVCLPESVSAVQGALAATAGVHSTMVSGLGEAARVVSGQ